MMTTPTVSLRLVKTEMNNRDYKNTVITLRLFENEAVRFWEIMDAAKQRNPYAGKSDIYRELLGIEPLNLLTKDELMYFQTGRHSKSVPLMTIGSEEEDKRKTG